MSYDLSEIMRTNTALKPDQFVLTDGDSPSVPQLTGDAAPKYPSKVKVFIDHETPCGSEKHAAVQKALIDFAVKNECALSNGRGISYQVMLDKFVKPGDIIAHCGDFGGIYGAAGALAVRLSPQEMSGALRGGEVNFSVSGTHKLCLRGELGAGVSGKDAVLAWLSGAAGKHEGKLLLVNAGSLAGSDKLAFFQMLTKSGAKAVLSTDEGDAGETFDLASVRPAAADAVTFAPAESGTPVTAVFIGGCSQGRIEDIRRAADVMRGRRVNRYTRVTIAFATTECYIQACDEGLIDVFLDAGAVVMNQGCSACYAHSQGLADGKDVVLSAGSRVCPNCNPKAGGSELVQTYLCSAATAARSALTGKIEL